MRQHLSAIALVVSHYDEAIDYYTTKLGFELVEDTDMSIGANPQPGKRWGDVARSPIIVSACWMLLVVRERPYAGEFTAN